MIKGIHGLFYSSDPDATRKFFREQVQLPGSDIGQGWWIFDLPEGDLGVHPADHGAMPGKHDISFYCDDIEGTVKGMRARGVEFTTPIEDHGYGLVTYFAAPGGITVQLYEPRYQKGAPRDAAKKPSPSRAKAKATAKVKTKVPAAKKKASKKKGTGRLRGLT
jgi:predicted enzyme related to lactoylglutathione lyase